MITPTIPLEQHTKEILDLRNEIKNLNEQIEWFKKQIFGQKADKFIDTTHADQLCFEGFDKLEPISPQKKIVPAHERAKRNPMR